MLYEEKTEARWYGQCQNCPAVCTWQDISYTYIHRALCKTYYKRGKDALPRVVSLLTHRHPRSLILPGSNDFGHFMHYCQGHQTRFQVSTKRSVTNFTIVKKSNLQTLFWLSFYEKYGYT